MSSTKICFRVGDRVRTPSLFWYARRRSDDTLDGEATKWPTFDAEIVLIAAKSRRALLRADLTGTGAIRFAWADLCCLDLALATD